MLNELENWARLRGRRMQRRELAGFLFATTFLLSFLSGCNADIGDQMIRDMEIAQATAQARPERIEAIKREQAKNPGPIIPSLDYESVARGQALGEERKEAVARAVQKYFPPGMKAEEAFKLLRQLKEDGFYVAESRREAGRSWPDGELKPEQDEETRRYRQRHYPGGMSEFRALKEQRSFSTMFFERSVVIKFRVVDGSGVISEVTGDIWITGI